MMSPICAAMGWMALTYGSPGLADPEASTGIWSRLMKRRPPLLPLRVITYTMPDVASSGIVTLMRESVHST